MQWDGKRCKLGNTQQYRLMEELIISKNKCVPFSKLATRLGEDEDYKLAPVKRRLVQRLTEVGMAPLAARIKASKGHYGLIFDDSA